MHLLIWFFLYDFVNTKYSIPIQSNPIQNIPMSQKVIFLMLLF